MDVEERSDAAAARVAAAIGEPSRARMLFTLMDGRARTSTELAALAAVGAPTASAHLQRLRTAHLVEVQPQGKHRYYTLAGAGVAAALEALSVLAGGDARPAFRGTRAVPSRLRAARS
ncbi:MAG: ArsR/SmtB family transcription factor, partial [Terriglobales bacterium]